MEEDCVTVVGHTHNRKEDLQRARCLVCLCHALSDYRPPDTCQRLTITSAAICWIMRAVQIQSSAIKMYHPSGTINVNRAWLMWENGRRRGWRSDGKPPDRRAAASYVFWSATTQVGFRTSLIQCCFDVDSDHIFKPFFVILRLIISWHLRYVLQP